MRTISNESLRLFIETRDYFAKQKRQAELEIMTAQLETITGGKPIILVGFTKEIIEKLKQEARPRYL